LPPGVLRVIEHEADKLARTTDTSLIRNLIPDSRFALLWRVSRFTGDLGTRNSLVVFGRSGRRDKFGNDP
jgi:hypothetical protein